MGRVLFIFVTLLLFISFLNGAEKISLQLKWKHGFQFAGYYAAKEKGFYKQEGLDVEFFERDLRKKHYIDMVADGDKDYGITDTALVLAHEKGQSVVWLTQIFQKSPLVLMSLKSSNIISPYDLEDKRVSYDYKSVGDTPIHLMFTNMHKDLNFQLTPIGYKYDKLIKGEVDAVSGYISDQPFWFKERGIDINIINPASYGIEFYGDNLFTSKSELENNPERVEKMIRATLKGWRYALENKEEIVDLILQKYSSKKSKEHLMYEAKMTELLILPNIIELGTIDERKIEQIYKHYKQVGRVKGNSKYQDLIYNFNSHQKANLSVEEKKFIQEKKTIKSGALKSFPPFSYVENDEVKGYSIDYVNTLTKKIGADVEFVIAPWPKLLQMMRSGEIDFMPYIAKNSQREKSIDFTEFKSLVYSLGLVVRRDSSLENITDFNGKKLAVIRKTFTHTFIEKNFPEIELVFAKSSEDAVKLVSREKVEGFIGSTPSINFYIQKNWIDNLKVEEFKTEGISSQTDLYMGVNKGNTLLKTILEKANGKLTYAEEAAIKNKWVSVKPSESEKLLSIEEQEFLREKKSLNVCSFPSLEPYWMAKGDGSEGIIVDYFNLFNEKLKIDFNPINTKNFLESKQFLEDGKCDVISYYVGTKSIREQFLVTKAYLNSPRVFVVKSDSGLIRDFNEISGGNTGINTNSPLKEILKELYPDIQTVAVENTQDGLKRVASGEIDSFVNILGATSFAMQKYGLTDVKIGGRIPSDVEFSILISKENYKLLPIFNKLIDSIEEDEKNSIHKKWISVKYDKDIDYTLIWQLLAVSAVIIGLILYRNRSIEILNNQLLRLNKELEGKKSELLAQQEMVDKYILITTTDLRGTITYANEAFCRVTGFTQQELIGAKHSILKHDDMEDKVYFNLWKSIMNGQSWKGEIKNRKKDGSSFWVNVYIEPIYNTDGAKIGYRAIREDITDKKHIEELSITDKLTGLYNRLKLDEILIMKIDEFNRYKTPFSVILLDIDDFKMINDTYGHDVGDYVLKEISSTIESNIRNTDFVGRWGGEEFVVVCSETTLEATNIVAEKIRRKVEEKELDEVGFKTISLGVTEFREEDSFSSVFKRVDEALYKAKKSGKNKVEEL